MSRHQPLLDRVAGDLNGCRLDPVGPGLALLVTTDGPQCWWQQRDDHRRLLRMQHSRFHLDGGPAAAAAPDTRVVLRHTGQLRRTGLDAKVRGRDAASRSEADALVEQLLADGDLAAACLPLDFTDFTLTPTDGRWRAELELMGGSHVRTVLPPSSSYVRLASDQVDALLATVQVLHRRLPVDPATLQPPAPRPVTARPDRHLPRSSE